MRLKLIEQTSASPAAAALLERTQSQLGRVPNLYRAMANSPAALEGYLSFRGALVAGVLDTKMRERLALLVAEVNECGYCVSAHMFRGSKIGLGENELKSARKGVSEDPKIDRGMKFARRVMEAKGDISDAELDAARQAGWTDDELSEIVAHVALNVFSNYFNHLAKPELDFPPVPA